MLKISYGKQSIDDEDVYSVGKSLKNEKITTGPLIKKFESKIKELLKCNYASVCNSGTSAIFLALKSIDVKKNDIIIMPSVNFIASYNVSKFLGAKIYLTDVDKYTGQMRPIDLENCIKKFKIKKIKAVITMYLGGFPENIVNFYNLKKKYGFYIIEDACHALGASYFDEQKKKYNYVGSCVHSDISTFSLHSVKSITTGEGGIITTNNYKISKKINKLRSHGISRRNNYWEYDVDFTSLNFRLTDFQCALGISQLKKLKKFINYRKKTYEYYFKILKQIDGISMPKYHKLNKSSFHLFIIHLKKFNYKRKSEFIKFLNKKFIFPQFHYIPIYKFKIFNGKFLKNEAEIYYNRALSLPIFYGIKKKDQDYIGKKIKEYFK